MHNTVIFNAVNATVQTTLNSNTIGNSENATQLHSLLEGYDLTLANTTFMHSSDVDFASEEGFASDDAAHAIIDKALAML